MKKLKDNWVIILVALVVLSVVLQFKRIGNLFGGLFTSVVPVEPLNSAGSDIADAQALSYAERLYTAMIGSTLNPTNENEFFSVFKNIVKPSDFNKVYNSFGKRGYNDFWGNDNIPATKRNLLYWLNAELTTEEKQYINDNYLSIF